MEHIDKIIQLFKKKATRYGAKEDDYVWRNNTGKDALDEGGAFFGFIRPEEENSGPYHDLSLVCFPIENNSNWLLCLGVGSLGFRNDYELASRPGVRRLFSSILDEKSYCKSDITDIETSLPKNFTSQPALEDLKKTIEIYTKLLPICQIIENAETSEDKFSAFIAMYAKIREWPHNKEQRNEVTNAINKVIHTSDKDDLNLINELLITRKYVILEGAPGVGKTYLAKELANKLEAKVFFTQFHAETTYGDFIYSIKPQTQNNNSFAFESIEGIFIKAVRYAIANKDKKTLLIIDEINRANLSNVLGPIFYLFEYQQKQSEIEIELCPGFKIKELPENLYVIGTMNTADRSLAVVDFALRRRFAWYKLKPQKIKADNNLQFWEDDFTKIQEIFYMYASDNELNLQPGQGYFLATNDAEMKQRIEYELFHLIKEYLLENLLVSAKEEFNNYFLQRIKKHLFE